MKTADFDFYLPPERIATHPVHPRDAARLLYVTDTLADKYVRDLPDLLRPGDLLVFNNTRVIPARLDGKRGEARVEFTLHKRLDDSRWVAFSRPAKRLRPGDTVTFAPDFSALVEMKNEGEVTLAFSWVQGQTFFQALEKYGRMPLPPYIARPEGVEERDASDYQTVFAAQAGAVAAPTAGLHFTPELLARLKDKGIRTAPVTLHVGAGTFLPVKVDDIKDHVMHAEYGEVSADTARRVNETKAAGGRIIAVGTTSLRLLESATDPHGIVHTFAQETSIFITPGYVFKCVDVLMTNFHLPRSTLFMLVCAFAGTERMKSAYDYAIQSGYRFYSYGDACLLEKNSNV